MDYLKQIEQKRDELARLIRDYVLSQKTLWQQIPYLAVMSSYREYPVDYLLSQESDDMLRFLCYNNGIVALASSDNGMRTYTLAINCETGELVCPSEKGDGALFEPDRDTILRADLEELNAQAIIDEYTAVANFNPDTKKITQLGYVSIESFQEATIRDYDLAEYTYTRKTAKQN